MHKRFHTIKRHSNSDSNQRTRLKVLCAAVALAINSPVFAQEQRDGRVEKGETAGMAQTPRKEAALPSIEVTARFGKEKAKDVPFGMSVMSGAEMESRRLYKLDSALRSTPGVDISSWGNAADANIRIRGAGSLYQVSRDDSSVVLNIDGVSLSSAYAPLGMLDVERVEVLKGPQGTLFGRSSGVGAINIITNKPTRHFEGHVAAEYGEDNQRLEEAVLSGPLSEQVSARLAIRESGEDHWVTNLEDGKPISNPSARTFRGSLLWQPGARTSALLTVEQDKKKQYSPTTVLMPYGDNPVAMFTPGTVDDNTHTLSRYSLELAHDLEDSRITSVTAMTTMEASGNKIYDKLVMQALYGNLFERVAHDDTDENVISQELRWQSLPGARVFWVAGMNFFHSDRSVDGEDKAMGVFKRDFATDSYALYGETTYPLTDRLKLTGGLRYTADSKTYDATYTTRSVSTDHREFDEAHVTGRTALSYAVTPQTNVYGTFSVGSKPGGVSDFSFTTAESEPYKASHTYMGELGFKSEALQGRLSLNGALFYIKVRDDHLMSHDYQTMATRTVSVDTRSQGAELEGRWQIDRHWSVGAAVTYLDAQIGSDAPGVSGGDVFSGNRVPDVPRWSGNLNVDYVTGLPGFFGLSAPSLTTQLNYRLVGKRAADPQNHFDRDSYGKLDLRIGLVNGNAEFYLWGDNLLDEQYDSSAYYFTPTVRLSSPARGRSVGAGVKWYF
ncbi:MAG: TonB-dependent receptor [Rhodocyclaceae bacterium]